MAVKIGIAHGEFVIRGGKLSSGLLCGRATQLGMKRFVKINKTSHWLSRLVCGESGSKNPLKTTSVFDKIKIIAKATL